MGEIFLRLLNVSINAGWLVLAVIVLRLIFKKAPRWIFCLLWALVGIRLLLPFSIKSVFSLIPSAETVPQEIFFETEPKINSGIAQLNNAVNPVISSSLAPAPGDSANPVQVYGYIAGVLWAVGLAAMLIYALVSWIMLRRKVRTATRLRENIFQSEAVGSPFVLGIFCPRIYLPYDISEEDSRYVIEHERAHLRRGDHLIKPLGFLLLSVYWFNPLLWAAYILLCRDIEFACDEKVISGLEEQERRAYSKALLSQSIDRRRISACPLAFGEVGVKERIKSVMNYKKPAFWVMIAALIVCAVTAVCFLTDPAGIRLTQLSDAGDYSGLTDGVVYAELYAGADINIISGSDVGAVTEFVETIRISRTEISQSRSEERDSYYRIMLRCEGGDTFICISSDFTELWINDDVKPTLSYRVMNAEEMHSFFSGYFGADGTADGEVQTQTADAAWSCAFVGYSHNGSMKLSVDALNKDSLSLQGSVHLPIMKISSTAELEDFCRRYANDFTLSEGSDGEPSFMELCAGYDNSFFEQRTLFIIAFMRLDDMHCSAVRISNEDGELRILVNGQSTSDESVTGDTGPLTWFITVEAANDYIAGCSSYDAMLGDDWVESVTYICYDSPDFGAPSLTLSSDGRFTFIYSMLSSYIGWGEYSVDGEYLVLKTDDGLYEYTFRIDGDRLIFVEGMSSPIPTYCYAPGEEPRCPVSDGSVFELQQ